MWLKRWLRQRKLAKVAKRPLTDEQVRKLHEMVKEAEDVPKLR